eukprot:2944743-Rhodomonas_salina.2
MLPYRSMNLEGEQPMSAPDIASQWRGTLTNVTDRGSSFISCSRFSETSQLPLWLRTCRPHAWSAQPGESVRYMDAAPPSDL